MKKLMLVCALAMAACGGGTKKAETTTDTTTDTTNTTTDATTTDPNTSTSNTDPNAGSATPTGDGQPCAQEIAMECPEGQIDACLKSPPEGDTHTCVAK